MPDNQKDLTQIRHRLQKAEMELARLQEAAEAPPAKPQPFWHTPLGLSVAAGIGTALLAIVNNFWQFQSTKASERTKLESSLILKGVEAPTQAERLKALQFFADCGLLPDSADHIRSLKADAIPRVSGPGASPSSPRLPQDPTLFLGGMMIDADGSGGSVQLTATAYRTPDGKSLETRSVPFIALPAGAQGSLGVPRLGDLALVYNTKNDKWSFAIFGDVGSPHHLGEGSMALADRLAIDSSPISGGIDSSERVIAYAVFPDTSKPAVYTAGAIDEAGKKQLESLGGIQWMQTQIKNLMNR